MVDASLLISGLRSVVASVIKQFKFSSVRRARFLVLINFIAEKDCSQRYVLPNLHTYRCANERSRGNSSFGSTDQNDIMSVADGTAGSSLNRPIKAVLFCSAILTFYQQAF
jgi:hypothetical protein